MYFLCYFSAEKLESIDSMSVRSSTDLRRIATPQLLKVIKTIFEIGKWFDPRSFSRLCGLIVRVRVVPRRTVVGDIDRRFNNLSGSDIIIF